ncbi:MAG TPA: FecR domain-containing protein, partial [Ohtaekwangia sp.]|nr:FecR domain-containing protein [Ohtaekwangia sp.]
LAAKLLTGSLTPAEQSEWEAMLQDSHFKNEFELVRKHWNNAGTLPYLQINHEEDWKKVMGRIQDPDQGETRFSVKKIWRYAAVITLLVAASFLLWKANMVFTPDPLATTIEAPAGARTFITLPDSSRVWLNAGTKITFNQDFGSENRDLTLEGEAFFDVARKDVCFNVHTLSYDITVLGTAFNVKAYRDDDITSTTLLRGALKVSRVNPAGETEEVILRPNEKMILRGLETQRMRQSMVVEKNIDAIAESDWKDGWLTVRGESLHELSKKIERLYNVKILFENENLKSYRYTGRIQQFSLEQVLKALSLTSPVTFQIHEKTVTLSEDQSAKSKYQSQQTP